jgi:hypothetical protein
MAGGMAASSSKMAKRNQCQSMAASQWRNGVSGMA